MFEVVTDHDPLGHFGARDRIVGTEKLLVRHQIHSSAEVDVRRIPAERINILVRGEKIHCRDVRTPPDQVVVHGEKLLVVECQNNHLENFGPRDVVVGAELFLADLAGSDGIHYRHGGRIVRERLDVRRVLVLEWDIIRER